MARWPEKSVLLQASARSRHPRPGTRWGLKKRPWVSSHRRFPLSVNFLLLPLHPAETVEATEASESELGHALGQAGGCSPEICRERQEEEEEEGAGERQEREASWG